MTEIDIAYLLSETVNRWWVIHQWWVSISIGLLVVAYIAGSRLNFVLVGAGLFLYSAFSVWIWALVTWNEELLNGFAEDLIALRAAGSVSSRGIELMVSQDVIGRYGFWGEIARFGTFASVVVYVLYSAIHAKRKRLASQR